MCAILDLSELMWTGFWKVRLGVTKQAYSNKKAYELWHWWYLRVWDRRYCLNIFHAFPHNILYDRERSVGYAYGVVMDSNLTFNAHITALRKACHFHLRSLRHIRRSLTDDMAILIAVALVQSRLDYTATPYFSTCHVSISTSSSVSKIFLPGLLSMIGAHPPNNFFLNCTGSLFNHVLNLKFVHLHINYFL